MKFLCVILVLKSIILITLAEMTPEEAAYEATMAQLEDPANPDGTTEDAGAVHTDHVVTYGYGDGSYGYPPEQWSEISPACNGDRQSPIDIQPMSCETNDVPVMFNRFDDIPTKTTLTNLGHTVQFTFEYGDSGPTVTLNDDNYFLAQCHFHFGKNASIGSEHTVNHYYGSMEKHCVFFNGKYGDSSTASGHSDGLIVVAHIYKEKDYVANKLFTEHLDKVIDAESYYSFAGGPGYSISSMSGSRRTKFVSYPGSLTTPPCSQSVTWFVALRFRGISHSDIAKFRALHGEHGADMAGDYRPTQAGNGRWCKLH